MDIGNDKVILQELCNGNHDVFDLIVKHYYLSLCSIANMYMKDIDASRDIVQDIFVKLWENRDYSPKIDSLKNYLFISVRNLCLNHIRYGKRIDTKESLMSITISDNENDLLEQRMIEEETNKMLDEAIGKLADRSAQVIRHTMEGYSMDEISKLMSISINTVKSLKYEALRKLKTLLEPKLFVLIYMMSKKQQDKR